MITNNIKQRRQTFNLTQEELAKKANVGLRRLVDIENNKAAPSLENAFKLAKAFDCTIEDIFNWSENK